jgi:uracil-DNA glycosylase family 4
VRWGHPDGDPRAPLVVVARDFGWKEEIEGIPLVGPSGKLLAKAMRHAGFARGDALFTNVVNGRPPADKWEAHARADVDRGLAALHELLALHRRRLIVTLGNEAFRAVTLGSPYAKTIGIEEARGYVFPSPYGDVLPMVHPAAILRQWVPWWACFEWDWQKAARLLSANGGGVERGERIITHAEAARAYVEQAKQAALVAVDSETDGAGEETVPACFAFAATPTEGVCFPLTEWSRPFIAELLASDVPKVFQNLPFDVTIAERDGFEVRNAVHDIMLMWHAVEPLLAGKQKEGQRTEKNLRFLVSLLVDGQPFYKDYDFETPEERWRLCAIDARCTLEIAESLLCRMQA